MGTLAKVLRERGSCQRSSELSGRQTHSLCPESRNFSKPAITTPSGGSQQIPRWRDGSPAQSPHGYHGVCRATHPPSGCPRGRGCFLCNSATANHSTQQESSRFGLAPVQDFCLTATFLPPSLFSFQCKVPPDCTPASLRIQLETLPKARIITLLQRAACPAWAVQAEEQI